MRNPVDLIAASPGVFSYQRARGYDGFWRQNTATDARNGTSTSYFNNLNLVTETVTPSPGGLQPAEVTVNYYDQTGRLLGSQLPDGTYTTNSYYATGWLAASSGSRTYAVGYSYDGQGRMKTMTNWGQAGAEVTTWSYDQYRVLNQFKK
jgi:YD repeat-containing protein